MELALTGRISILAVVAVYWVIILAISMVKGRAQARRAPPGPDGRVVLSGQLSLLRAAAVLLGPPAAFVLLLWLITFV